MLEECPPVGLCLHVDYVRARDADTIEVRIHGSAFVWAVRLLECWAPPLRSDVGARGKAFVEDILEDESSQELRLYVPPPKGQQPLKALTFDRILGYLFVDDTTTLNQMVVSAGLASTTKGGAIGM